jgi:hypothetical protein
VPHARYGSADNWKPAFGSILENNGKMRRIECDRIECGRVKSAIHLPRSDCATRNKPVLVGISEIPDHAEIWASLCR